MRDSIVAGFKPHRHDHAGCIADALDEAEALCARNGLRLTRLRRRVLELVWSRHEPVRAYDLLDQLREEHHRAAPPTVYRALEFLMAHGLIHRIESMNAYVGCGAPGDAHNGQFLICGDCGATGELNDPEIARLIAAKASTMGFSATLQTVEVTGTCPDCARKANDAV